MKRLLESVFLLAAAVAFSACGGGGSDGDDGEDGQDGAPGPAGQPGVVEDVTLTRFDDLPGTTFEILSVSGGTGPSGRFRAGDMLSVHFTVKRADGSSLLLSSLDTGSIYVSGPTTNYQRVLPRQTNLRNATMNADGTYTYTFASPIPAVYAAPYNDTASFDADDGELSGLPLLDGTYTVGIEGYKNYSIGGESFRDTGNAVFNFLFGGAATIDTREVVKQENCNGCHVDFRIHGGNRKDVRLCALCHTAGAEDRNGAVSGGTPGATIDFRVMIHKIHAGAHLPSVLGVGTKPDGTRDYTVPPKPYELVGFSAADFSHVEFPAFPNFSSPMPRDMGYSALTSGQRSTEDQIRRGPTDCAKCHGDPDGAGPVTAPAQGDQIFTTGMSRRACASCHDDIDWSRPYTANGFIMPAQANDNLCNACHGTSAPVDLDARIQHVHPLDDPAVSPGLHFEITGVAEAGTNDGDGTIDPGEKVAVSFTMKDHAGGTVPPASLSSAISMVLSGPTTNLNLLSKELNVPAGAIGPGPNHMINLPEAELFELIGHASDDGAIEAFTTMRAPHWHSVGAATTVYERTATGVVTTLTAPAAAGQNYVDVASTTGFAVNGFVVLDDGMPEEEYRQIGYIEGNRVFFRSPFNYGFKSGLSRAHSNGAGIAVVTLTVRTAGTHYTLSEATGTITEAGVASFAAGNAVVVSYTADFVMPDVFPMALNGSPDLDETHGKWEGKPIADGTYTISMWASRSTTLMLHGESNTYRDASRAGTRDFLVGSATSLVPWELIESGESCESCHNDIRFHGSGRRGWLTCLSCHGTAGAEDRPKYITASSAATTGESINFRTMLHKIHAGGDLTNASTYAVVGFGGTSHNYEHVVFPALPGGVQHCAKCHGSAEAWQEPTDRNHPTLQNVPVRNWTVACSSCHDSAAAAAHMELQTTTSGAESCAVCHKPDRDYSVDVSHKAR